MTTINNGSYSIPIRFQLSNQSIWGTGSDSFKTDTGSALCLGWDLEGHHKDKIKSVWPFGKFGSRSDLSSQGNMGFKIGAGISGGTVDLDCPATVDVSYPTSAAAGEVVTLTSSLTLNNTATMHTTAPDGTLALYFHSEGQFSSSAKVKAFSANLLDYSIGNFSLDVTPKASDPPPPDPNDRQIYELSLASLAQQASQYATFELPGELTLSLHYPNLTTSGGLDSSKTQLHASRADMILLMSLDITDLITDTLEECGIEVPPLHEEVSLKSEKGFKPSYKVGFDYSLLDVFVDADAGLALDFTFEPRATISYAVQDAGGNHPTLYTDAACSKPLAGAAPVGAPVYFRMPTSGAITVTPTVHRAGTFTNKPGIKLVGGVNLDVFEIGAGGSVSGISLPGFSWKPLPTQRAQISRTFPIATLQFDPKNLGADVVGPAFSVVPSTMMMAKSTASSGAMLAGLDSLKPSSATPSSGPLYTNNPHSEALLVAVTCDMACPWSACPYQLYWDVEDGAHALSAQTTQDPSVLQVRLTPDLLVAGEHKVICVCGSGADARRTVMDFDVQHWAPVISGLLGGGVAMDSVPAGSATQTLTLKGAGFGADSRIFVGPTPVGLHAGSSIQPNQLTVDVPAALLTVPGNFPLTVVNPAPGGGSSAPVMLTVASPKPQITSITPNNAEEAIFLDGPDTPIDLVGEGFVPGCVVIVNGSPVETSFLSPTSAGAVIPAELLTHDRFNPSSKPLLSVSIATPTVVSASGKVTGGASGTLSVPLQIPKPYLGSVSPSSMTVGAPISMQGSSGGSSIQIEGANFLPGAALSVSTSGGQVVLCKLQTSNDGTHATFILPIELLQAPDVLTVDITNDFGGQKSSIQMPYQVLKESFAGAVDGTLYAVDGEGRLRWYRDLAQDGTTCWAPSSGNVIAEGWGDYLLVVPAENGILYAVTPAGDLLWFQDLGRDGTASWAPSSGSVVGHGGWTQFQRIVYGGNGMLYCITKTGDLRWYQDLARNGTERWAPGSASVIATGWNRFLKVVSGGSNAVLYAVDATGNLFFYQDAAHNGTSKWAPGSGAIVGQGGWTQFTHILSGGHGILYPVQGDGGLRWYQDLACNGTIKWAANSTNLIATGWVYDGDDGDDSEA